eukprot:gene4273-14384_t
MESPAKDPVFLGPKFIAKYKNQAASFGRQRAEKLPSAVQQHATLSEAASIKVFEDLHQWAPQFAAQVHESHEHRSKRRDFISTGAASAASSVVPFTGILVSAPFTLYECFSFLIDVGLVSKVSHEDIVALFKARYEAHRGKGKVEKGRSRKSVLALNSSSKSMKEGVKAALEAACIDVIKIVAGDWLVPSLVDVLATFSFEVAMELASILPGVAVLLWPVKYALQRHQIHAFIERMKGKASDRHVAWLEQNRGMLLVQAQLF